MKTGKQMKCAYCKTRFDIRIGQRSFENWCSPECGYKLAMKKKEASLRINELATRKIIAAKKSEIRIRKEALKGTKELKADLKHALHAWIRNVRDADAGCISCWHTNETVKNSIGGGWDAGHFRSVGSTKELEFDPRNIHKQCKKCNMPYSKGGKGGNYDNAEEEIVRRYGTDIVEWIEGPHNIKKFTTDDLRIMINFFRSENNKAKKEAKCQKKNTSSRPLSIMNALLQKPYQEFGPSLLLKVIQENATGAEKDQ